MGNKYDGAAIHVIENKKGKINYTEDIYETTPTRPEELIHKEKLKILWIKKHKMMRNLRKFTESCGENALAQWKQNLNHIKNMKTSEIHKT